MPELVTRLAAMHTAFRPIRARVLCNQDIPEADRLNIVKGFLLAKGLHQFSTFRAFNIVESKKVHSSVMSIYRAMLGADRPQDVHYTDDQIIRRLNVLAPLAHVSYLRVHLFVRMFVRPPAQLWHMLANTFAADRSWLATINNELNHIATASNRFLGLVCTSLLQWLEVIIPSAYGFLSKLDKALKCEEVSCSDFWMPPSPHYIRPERVHNPSMQSLCRNLSHTIGPLLAYV